jgi:putative membrane protein
MPLGLYEPFVAGIGHMDLAVLIPGGIGTLATVVLCAKAVNSLFQKHYSVSFHAIVGVVIAATIMIIPFRSFAESFASFVMNWACLIVGILVARWLEQFNRKYTVK